MNKDTHPLEDEHKFPACISKMINLYNIFKLSPVEDINCFRIPQIRGYLNTRCSIELQISEIKENEAG